MPGPFFSGECTFCLRSSDSLLRCSICSNVFHKDSCGKLPTETEYERADPDDLLRGMSFAGRRVTPNYKAARCGNCIPYSDQRRTFVRETLPDLEAKRAFLLKEIEDCQLKRNERLETTIDLTKDFTEVSNGLEQVKKELALERKRWIWLDRQRTRVAKPDENEIIEQLEYTLEIGRDLAYQEFFNS